MTTDYKVEEARSQDEADLRERFSNLGKQVGDLVGQKQFAYGDSFGRSGRVLKELYPNGIRPDQYADLLTIARVLDKLFRLANQKDAFGESPWNDILGYSLLSVAKDEDRRVVGREQQEDKQDSLDVAYQELYLRFQKLQAEHKTITESYTKLLLGGGRESQ